MPSLNLAKQIDCHLEVEADWVWSGEHYRKTSEHWLENMDRHKEMIMPILASTYGAEAQGIWWHRWRLFFLACAEIFGFQGGKAWPVSHYRFRKRLEFGR